MQFLTDLNSGEVETFTGYWDFFVHRYQKPPRGDWTTWLLLGGRGAGKTRTGAQWVKALACGKGAKVSPIALIGETEHDAREVMVEGVSGLLAAHHRFERPEWIPSRRRLQWPSGAVAQVFSADDPESLRGPQFAAAWCDELAKWRYAEARYTHHPSDPGGPTNFGITIHDYRRYVKAGATAADVRAMGLDEARAIYRSKYWDAMRCDDLPAGLDYAVFDYGVNSGTGRAIKVLQRLLGLADDGRMNEALLKAARNHDAAGLIGRLCDERLAFLKRLKTWPVFGAGWGRRVAEVRAAALVMAAGSPLKTKPQSGPSTGKGAVPVNAQAQKGTVGGIAASGAAAAQQAHQAGLRPGVVILIVLATLALAIGGWFAWRWHQQRRQLAPN